MSKLLAPMAQLQRINSIINMAEKLGLEISAPSRGYEGLGIYSKDQFYVDGVMIATPCPKTWEEAAIWLSGYGQARLEQDLKKNQPKKTAAKGKK